MQPGDRRKSRRPPAIGASPGGDTPFGSPERKPTRRPAPSWSVFERWRVMMRLCRTCSMSATAITAVNFHGTGPPPLVVPKTLSRLRNSRRKWVRNCIEQGRLPDVKFFRSLNGLRRIAMGTRFAASSEMQPRTVGEFVGTRLGRGLADGEMGEGHAGTILGGMGTPAAIVPAFSRDSTNFYV